VLLKLVETEADELAVVCASLVAARYEVSRQYFGVQKTCFHYNILIIKNPTSSGIAGIRVAGVQQTQLLSSSAPVKPRSINLVN